jgi:hypothetical protein
MIQSRKSWNQTMFSITGVAPFCKPSSHGCGCPVAAKAAPPPARTVTPVTTNAINRLSNSIVVCAPSTRKTALESRAPLRRPPRAMMFGAARLMTAFCHGRGSFCYRAAGPGGSPGLSNHNSGAAAMRLHAVSRATDRVPHAPFRRRIYATGRRLAWTDRPGPLPLLDRKSRA